MMRRALALIVLALALAAPARAQIYPGYGTPTLLGNGSSGAPAYSFAADPFTGIWRHASGGRMGFAIQTVPVLSLFSTEVRVGSSFPINWSSGDPDAITPDAGIKRIAAGTLGVTAGGSTAFANVGGVLFLEANNVANSSTLAQVLHTYTLPANVLTVNGKTLRVTTMFATVNNANAKAVQINVCGSLVASLNTTASIAGSIRIETLITRTGLNTQAAQVTAVEGINSSTLTQAKQSATYNIALACTETATFTINANVNTAALSDASSAFHMVELLN